MLRHVLAGWMLLLVMSAEHDSVDVVQQKLEKTMMEADPKNAKNATVHLDEADLDEKANTCLPLGQPRGPPSRFFHQARSGCSDSLQHNKPMLFASYPRSGNSWLGTFLVNATGFCIHGICNHCEHGGSLMEKSHYPLNDGTPPDHSHVGHIWLVRNPWDAAFSNNIEYDTGKVAEHYRKVGSHAHAAMKDWLTHTVFWRKQFKDGESGKGPKVLLVRYEDALKQPADVVHQILVFLKAVRDPSIPEVSQQKLKDLNSLLACKNIGSKCTTGVLTSVGKHSQCWGEADQSSHKFAQKLDGLAAELGYHRNGEMKLDIKEPSGIFAESEQRVKVHGW